MTVQRVVSVVPGTRHEDTHFGFLMNKSMFYSARYAGQTSLIPRSSFSAPSSSERTASFLRWPKLPPEIQDAILDSAFSVPSDKELRRISLYKYYYNPMKPDILCQEAPLLNNLAAGAVLLGLSVELVQLFVSKEFLRAALPCLARHTAITINGCS